jgi:hypothetical protein
MTASIELASYAECNEFANPEMEDDYSTGKVGKDVASKLVAAWNSMAEAGEELCPYYCVDAWIMEDACQDGTSFMRVFASLRLPFYPISSQMLAFEGAVAAALATYFGGVAASASVEVAMRNRLCECLWRGPLSPMRFFLFV